MDDMEKEKKLQDEEVSGREEETAERREAASEQPAADPSDAAEEEPAEERAEEACEADEKEEASCGHDGQGCDESRNREERHCHEGKERGHCHRELEKAREEIAALRQEAEECKRKWYAVTAEYENYRRRTQNQASQRYTEGRNDVVAELFPVGDNLERALSACADEKTRQGLEMVLKSYKKVLEGEGIEEIDPTGQPFDANVAEAIMAVPSADGEEAGLVRQVYVKGYKRGGKVLRYAQVIVTQ